jgi:hypothetical protein
MSGKADFSAEEWETIAEAPGAAGMMLVTASHGGMFRETLALAKAYTEARQKHGQSPLLDELVSSKPKLDHTRYHSPDELRQATLAHVRDAVALVQAKATPAEASEYGQFIVAVADRVAHAHREDGAEVSPAEQSALDDITAAVATR